jgi:uncharacterized protein YnzC (UPF0291/DUF896 family)
MFDLKLYVKQIANINYFLVSNSEWELSEEQRSEFISKRDQYLESVKDLSGFIELDAMIKTISDITKKPSKDDLHFRKSELKNVADAITEQQINHYQN